MKPMTTILVVDDSPNDLLMTQMALNELEPPPQVDVAHDGAEALEFLERRSRSQPGLPTLPNLILLDLKMPRLDGFEVLRQLKGNPQLRHIPVVVFTSSREEADLRLCYELGANGYVVKPVDFLVFVTTVKGIGSFWGGLNEAPVERSTTQEDAAHVITAA